MKTRTRISLGILLTGTALFGWQAETVRASAPDGAPAATQRFVRLVVEIPRTGPHRIDLYDALGTRVRSLRDEVLPAGRLAVQWDGRDERGGALPGGRYWIRVDDRALGSVGLVR